MDRKTPHQDNDLTKTPAPKTSKSIQKFKQEYYPVLSGFIPSTFRLHTQHIPSTFRHHTQYIPLYIQSLEFVAETRILAEMKIEIRGKIFFRGKTNWQTYFFFKQSVGVAESLEITPWTNASLPAKLSVDGVIVRGRLHISSYFRYGSIRPVLIGQKRLLNQWTSTLHSKLNGS